MDWKDSHATIKFVCASCGYEHEMPIECGDRTCPQCGRVRGERIIKRLKKEIQKMKNPHLVTLTLKRRVLTRDNVSLIRKYFTRLRHKKVWKGVTKGFYNIELGNITEDGYCNIHIHTIYDGPDIPQKELSKAWRGVTKDSYVVWIERSRGRDAECRYLAKHFCKVAKGSTEGLKKVINSALKNTKLVQGFGELRALPSKGPSECPQCHALNPFISSHSPAYYVVLAAFDGLEYAHEPA